jgi:RNA recognition motif-containing protein
MPARYDIFKTGRSRVKDYRQYSESALNEQLHDHLYQQYFELESNSLRAELLAQKNAQQAQHANATLDVQTPTSATAHFKSTSLYVGELDPFVTETMLYDLFASVGHIASIRIVKDPKTRRSLGYAYVNYFSVEDAEKAFEELNYTVIKGKPCLIMRSNRGLRHESLQPASTGMTNHSKWVTPREPGWDSPAAPLAASIDQSTFTKSFKLDTTLYPSNPPNFVIPPKTNKAIVIKSPDGEVVDFTRETNSPAQDVQSRQTESKVLSEKIPQVECEMEAEKNASGKLERVEVPITPSVIFNTQLPYAAHSRRDGKSAPEVVQNVGRTERLTAKDGNVKRELKAKANSEENQEQRAQEESITKDMQKLGGAETSDTPFPELHQTKRTVDVADSSIYGSSNTFQSSSVVATELTTPTSVSGKGASGKHFNETQNIQPPIHEVEEPEKDSGDNDQPFDGQSTISGESCVVLTTKERNDILEKFSMALLRDLTAKGFTSDNENIAISTFQKSLSESIKTYSVKVMMNAERRSRPRRASKAIRFLRNDIVRRCYDGIGGFRHSRERNKPSIVQRLDHHDASEKTAAEKISDWHASILDVPDMATSEAVSSMILAMEHESSTELPTLVRPQQDDASVTDMCNLSDSTEQSFSQISQLSPHEDEHLSAEDQDAYEYLTKHSAFSELVEELRALVERLFCNQMELIHRRILLAIQRFDIGQRSEGSFRASFCIDWDVLDFLQMGYSLSQDLRHVITITGTPVDAQLATVETYLKQTWPHYTWELIDALNTTIAATIHGVERGM